MIQPEDVLREQLDGLVRVTILGKDYDLIDEVKIVPGSDLEEELIDHGARVLKWNRIEAKCAAQVASAQDALTQLIDEFFCGVWDGLEEKERAEMAAVLEDEVDRDEKAQAKADGDEKGFTFRRRATQASRVTSGPSACRWRRNFSDALVRSQVGRSPEVAAARARLRATTAQLNLCRCLVKTLDYRSRCLSHLCSLHRDNTRR